MHKRKQIWIDPRFQGQLVLRLGAACAVYCFLLWVGVFMAEVSARLLTADTELSLWRLNLEFLVWFLILTPLFMLRFVKFSHRLVGPLFRVRRMMREMADGHHPTEFTPRDGDLLQDFTADFNRLIRKWNEVHESNPVADESWSVTDRSPVVAGTR